MLEGKDEIEVITIHAGHETKIMSVFFLSLMIVAIKTAFRILKKY